MLRALLAALWLLLFAASAGAQNAAPGDGLITLDRGRLQAEGGPLQDVTLPHRVYRASRDFQTFRLEIDFDAQPAWRGRRVLLQLDSWPDGGHIEINGVEVADEQTSTERSVVRNLRPFGFVLPQAALHEGSNRLVMRWGARVTLVLAPRVHLGPRDVLEPLYERKLFWELTVLQSSLVFAAVVALVMLGIWWRQRDRGAPPEYLLIGLSALGWIDFNTVLLSSPVSADWFLIRRAFGFAGIGLFGMCMWMCLVRLAGARLAWFQWLCMGWVVAAPVMVGGGYLLTGHTHLPGVEMVWTVGAAGLGLVPLAVLVRTVLRAPSLRAALLLAVVLGCVLLAAREALIYVFQDPIGTVHLGIQTIGPLWLVTACGILVQDFVRSLRETEQQRDSLDRRLAEREAELARLHARERELATDEERRRIMQDMHDGLGSQLVSSLALAERGELSPVQTADLLRGCIDDLRLAIDTLGEGEIDLAMVAGNLRFRMAPRLQAAGIKLRWDLSGLPDALSLPGSVVLPLLRVLQEAMANAMRHSGARQLQIGLAAGAGALTLDVSDDGHGFDLDSYAAGNGLAGMKKRARALGAELRVASSAQGTTVHLKVPLVP